MRQTTVVPSARWEAKSPNLSERPRRCPTASSQRNPGKDPPVRGTDLAEPQTGNARRVPQPTNRHAPGRNSGERWGSGASSGQSARTGPAARTGEAAASSPGGPPRRRPVSASGPRTAAVASAPATAPPLKSARRENIREHACRQAQTGVGRRSAPCKIARKRHDKHRRQIHTHNHTTLKPQANTRENAYGILRGTRDKDGTDSCQETQIMNEYPTDRAKHSSLHRPRPSQGKPRRYMICLVPPAAFVQATGGASEGFARASGTHVQQGNPTVSFHSIRFLTEAVNVRRVAVGLVTDHLRSHPPGKRVGMRRQHTKRRQHG